MFRSELKSKLSQIFGFPKTTFDAPNLNSVNGSFEQDTLFIEVNETNARIHEGKSTARVLGSLVVFSQMEKLPFGFFNKKIEQAGNNLTKDFFFFDIDLNPISSPARYQNIAERRLRFVFLYSSQYDPSQGQITSLEGI
jgi:hypothetical protein